MAGRDPDEHDGDHLTPWYNRTPNAILASVAGLAVIGLTAAAGVLHYILEGPNTVTEHDEEEADRLSEEEGA